MDKERIPAFKNYNTAVAFTRGTLQHVVRKLTLNRRKKCVGAISRDLPLTGTAFREDIARASGKINKIDRHFTATALINGKSWKLKNLHLSLNVQSG